MFLWQHAQCDRQHRTQNKTKQAHLKQYGNPIQKLCKLDAHRCFLIFHGHFRSLVGQQEEEEEEEGQRRYGRITAGAQREKDKHTHIQREREREGEGERGRGREGERGQEEAGKEEEEEARPHRGGEREGKEGTRGRRRAREAGREREREWERARARARASESESECRESTHAVPLAPPQRTAGAATLTGAGGSLSVALFSSLSAFCRCAWRARLGGRLLPFSLCAHICASRRRWPASCCTRSGTVVTGSGPGS